MNLSDSDYEKAACNESDGMPKTDTNEHESSTFSETSERTDFDNELDENYEAALDENCEKSNDINEREETNESLSGKDYEQEMKTFDKNLDDFIDGLDKDELIDLRDKLTMDESEDEEPKPKAYTYTKKWPN